ncbi:helix-turn-helix domain-containing protein [Cellulomonas endometrii]|uniref:helix-turn-helix domain-containing protein n=1 Tax=Cellulomonas endometrii TaxID=3036301 RepID=UPI0024AE08E6|nr:helix-turn-helix transcriptional regulator [Cellulomonas endometrii]
MPSDSLSDDRDITPGQDVPGHEVVTATQVVAYNLARARESSGLTQAELGERLTALTGTPWSRATVSAAERGWTAGSENVRHFDADELLALSIVFGLPIAWFFLPPPTTPAGEDRIQVVKDWISPSKRPTATRTTIDDSELATRALDVRGLALGSSAMVEERFSRQHLKTLLGDQADLIPRDSVAAVANELAEIENERAGKIRELTMRLHGLTELGDPS